MTGQEAGHPPSRQLGDSCDHAMAGWIIWLHKAEVIHRRNRRDSLKQVEGATMCWVA